MMRERGEGTNGPKERGPICRIPKAVVALCVCVCVYVVETRQAWKCWHFGLIDGPIPPFPPF